MASRKSSILKPRKERAPLQDLNQLLPNNDDEETTTTEIAKRRVSFASTNKVKEFESAAECVTLKHTPVYDERFSISSDSGQSILLSVSNVESSNVSAGRQSVLPENADLEDDLEITETACGRIVDVPVKDAFDECSMELTTACTAANFEQMEGSGPLNLTKRIQNHRWNQTKKIDLNDSCMETTAMITTNTFAESFLSHVTHDHIPEYNLSIPAVPEPRKSIFHPLDGSLQPRKSIFEMSLPPSKIEDSLTNHENLSMDLSASQMEEENLSKSPITETLEVVASEMPLSNLLPSPTRNSKHNLSMPVVSQTSQNRTIFHNSSMQLTNPPNDTRYNNSSMQFLSQEVRAKIVDKSNIETVIEGDGTSQRLPDNMVPHVVSQNETRIDNLSMNIESQEEEVVVEFATVTPLTKKSERAVDYEDTDKIDITCQDSRQNSDPSMIENKLDEFQNKTRYSTVNMLIGNQDTESIDTPINRTRSNVDIIDTTLNKTRYSNVDMADTPMNKTRFSTANVQTVTQNCEGTDSVPNKTQYSAVNRSRFSVVDVQTTTSDEGADSGLNKTRYSTVNMADTTMNKTRFSIVPIQANTQDFEGTELAVNKTQYNTVNMADASMNKTLISTTNIQAVSQNNEGTDSVLNKTRYSTAKMQIASQDYEIAEPNDCHDQSMHEIQAEPLEPEQKVEDHLRPTIEDDKNETSNEIVTQKSINDSATLSNESNSPLTVDVNFSIYQKNKEMRVEFTGTIDSNRKNKSKSISNVQVNIFDNKKEKKKKSVRELRFSMPANKVTCCSSSEPLEGSDLKLSPKHDSRVDTINDGLKSVHLGEFYESSVRLDSVYQASYDSKSPQKEEQKQEEESPRTIAGKKRRSSEMMDPNEVTGQMKRPSLTNIQAETEESVSTDDKLFAMESTPRKVVPEETKIVTQSRRSFIQEEKKIMLNGDSDVIETHTAEQNIQTGKLRRSLMIETSFIRTEEVLNCSKTEKSNFQLDLSTSIPNKVEHEEKSNSEELAESKCRENANNTSQNELNQSRAFLAECSFEAPSDTCDQSPTVGYSTPFAKKSLVGLSILEDELDDNPLNNPSIMVNIGDSSHYKSLELASENSPLTQKEHSNEELKNPIEGVASDDISKENMVTDWLQNVKLNKKTYDRSDNNTLIGLENLKPSSLNKNQQIEIEILNLDTKTEIEQEIELVEKPEKSKTGNATENEIDAEKLGDVSERFDVQIQRSDLIDEEKEYEQISEEKHQESAEKEGLSQKGKLEEKLLVENQDHKRILEKQKETPEKIEKNVEPELNNQDLIPEHLIVEECPHGKENFEQIEVVKTPKIIDHSDQIKLDEEIANMSIDTDDEDIKSELKKPLELEEAQQNKLMCESVVHKIPRPEKSIYAVATDEKIHDQSTKGDDITIKDDDEDEQHMIIEQKLMDVSFAPVQDTEEILEKIRADLKGIREWSMKEVTNERWVFQLNKRLPQFFELSIQILHNSNKCLAKFEFSAQPEENDFEIKKIAFKWLIHNCGSKLHNLCHTLSDVYYLLKLTAADVLWTAKFVRDFNTLQKDEDIKLEHGIASFVVASYKQIVLFIVYVNLANSHKVRANNIEIREKIGKVDGKRLFRIFSEAGDDFDFFSKFVKRVYEDFEA